MKGIFKLLTALLACLPFLGPIQNAGASEWTPEMVAKVNAEAQCALGEMYARVQGVLQDNRMDKE